MGSFPSLRANEVSVAIYFFFLWIATIPRFRVESRNDGNICITRSCLPCLRFKGKRTHPKPPPQREGALKA